MSKANPILVILMLILGSFVQAVASTDYEELTYQDLVDQLSQKKSNLVKQNTPSPEQNYQVRVGFTNSFAKVNAPSSHYDISQGGVMVGFGLELEQKKWYAEGLFKNFSSSDHPNISVSFRELEARMGLQTQLEQKYAFKAFAGGNFRFLDYRDLKAGKSENLMTPSLNVGLAGEVFMNQIFSMGAEWVYRSPLASSSDLGSWDLSIYSGFRF